MTTSSLVRTVAPRVLKVRAPPPIATMPAGHDASASANEPVPVGLATLTEMTWWMLGLTDRSARRGLSCRPLVDRRGRGHPAPPARPPGPPPPPPPPPPVDPLAPPGPPPPAPPRRPPPPWAPPAPAIPALFKL